MWCRLKSIEARERAHRRQMWCRLKIKEARERVYSSLQGDFQSYLIHAIRGASYSRGFLTKAIKVFKGNTNLPILTFGVSPDLRARIEPKTFSMGLGKSDKFLLSQKYFFLKFKNVNLFLNTRWSRIFFNSRSDLFSIQFFSIARDLPSTVWRQIFFNLGNLSLFSSKFSYLKGKAQRGLVLKTFSLKTPVTFSRLPFFSSFNEELWFSSTWFYFNFFNQKDLTQYIP